MEDKYGALVTSKDGVYEVDTGITMIEEKRLDPRSTAEQRKEREEGPLYRIIASLNKFKEAQERKKIIMKRAFERGEKARVQIVPSSNEFQVLGRGLFTVNRLKPEGHTAGDEEGQAQAAIEDEEGYTGQD